MAETTKKKTTTRKTAAKPKTDEIKEGTNLNEIESAVYEAPVKTDVSEPEPTEKTFTESDVEAMIAAAVAKALAEAQRPQIVQVAADVERVQFLYMAEVADDNVYEIGPGGMYGRIVGKTGSFSVPKTDLSRVMDAMFRLMMERRWIVALNGLTDEEREAYGVDYKDGEVLTKRAFTKMVELGDQMLGIYPKLCKGHREMVAKRYFEEYMNGNPVIERETVVELNRMSRELDGGDGAFAKIIEAMNEADLKR